MVIYLTPAINKGRLTANQAIMAYNTGDKQPLGKLIKNGIQSIITRQKNSPSASTAAIDAEMARRMINMLDRDPELKAAAKQSGLRTKDIEYISCIETLGTAPDALVKTDSQESLTKLLKTCKKAPKEHGIYNIDKLPAAKQNANNTEVKKTSPTVKATV